MMKRKITGIVLTLLLCFNLAVPAFVFAAETAKPTASAVLVNGNITAFESYNIGGYNYFKLRDLAYVLSGTEKQFEVSWDSSNKAISLISGQPYTKVGGEMEGGAKGNKPASVTSSRIYLDGKEVSLQAYNIGGNNYFKLRDIGEKINFGVDWDKTKNTIAIDTSKNYTPEAAALPVLPGTALRKASARDSNLNTNAVPLIAENPIAFETYSVVFIGAACDISTGSPIQDALFVGTGLKNESVEDSFARGFGIGFYHGLSEENANKDMFLTLYVKFQPYSKGAKISPTFKITGKDDRGRALDLIYFSESERDVDPNNPYAIIIFKLNSGSNSFSVKLGDTERIISVSDLF